MAELLSPGDPEALRWWATGLADGEGCFFAGLRYRSGSQAGASASGKRYPFVDFSARFSVLLRADDLEVLNDLQRVFGVGYVYLWPKPYKKIVGKSGSRPNPMAEYRCAKVQELISTIVPHFQRYPLRSKKLRDFETWAGVVQMFESIDASTNKGWWKKDPEKLESLSMAVQSLRDGRKFAMPDVGGN